MMDKQLKEAINRQLNKRNVTYNSDGHKKECYDVRISGTHNHDDYIEILNNLPNLMNDTEKMTSIIGGLIGIIAQLQQELLELRNFVGCAVLDKIKVVIQENFNNHIEKLTQDNDIEGVMLNSNIEITTENQNSEDYHFDEKNKQINSQSLKIGGGLKGLLSILASLDMSKEEENANLNEAITKIDEKVTSSRKLDYKGKMICKYGKVKKSHKE